MKIKFPHVQQVLLDIWNPIGVCPDKCRDEYDSYAQDVLNLLNHKVIQQDIYDYLNEIEADYMGFDEANKQRLQQTVEALFKLKE